MPKKPTYEELEHRIQELEQSESESKRAGEALQKSEEQFRLAFENANVGVCFVDIDGNLARVNNRMCDIFGYSKKELESMTVNNIAHPEDKDISPKFIEKSISGEVESIVFEKRYIYKQGHIIWGQVSSSIIKDEKGELLYFISHVHDITQRKQAEEALRESEEKYKTIIENIEDGYYEVDIAGNFTFLNDSMCKILGYSKDELTGLNNRRYMDEENAKKVFKAFNRVYKTGQPYKAFDWELIRKDGSRCYVETSVALKRDSKGQPIGFQGIARDISERKQAEVALRESERKMKSIFQAAPIGIGVVINRVFQDVNERLCEITGYSKDELIGQTARIVYPTDEDYEYVGREKYRKIEESGTGAVETCFRRKDGEIINVLLSSSPIDPIDLSVGVTFTALDITERKRAEEVLRKSHERFLKVLNSIDATVYVADMETYEILFMNKYMIEGFGRDMTGEICWHVFRGESGPCSYCTNDQLIDENGKPTDVCVWQDKNPINGKWYVNHDRAIEWTDGHLVRLQIATDITEITKMEEELRQAQKMESIGTLTGGLAHDFNNILGIIIGNTELALGDVPDWNPVHSNLEEIKTASLRATNIVKQLLSFSRKTDQKLQPVEIALVIKDAMKFLRSTIPTTVNIQQDIQASDETILADPTQINQIMMNLCINASQAMEQTGGNLKISMEEVILDDNSASDYPDLRSGKHIKVTVSDTGPGIVPEIIDRIFDPYFTTKEVGKGSGMGLAVVHGIVKNYNGAISVDSKPGKGTTFSILLPVTSEKPVMEVKTPEEIPHGNESILFIDDEEPIVNMTQQMLERLGYKVETKMIPVEALEKFQSKPDQFDLVITDMTMPKMTGVMLSEKILEIRPDMPIIICTGHSSLIDEEKAKQLGIAAYVMKPIVLTKIAKTIRKVLDEAKSSAH